MVSNFAFLIFILLFGVSTAPAAASNRKRVYSKAEEDALVKVTIS